MGVTDFLTGGGEYKPDSAEQYRYRGERSQREKDVLGQTRFDSAARQDQGEMYQMYLDQAMGRGGPSLAEQQMREQGAANARSTIALARSGGGGALGGAGAMSRAQQSQAQQNADLARSAGTLRAQEQQMAMAGAAGMANAQRQAELGRLQAQMGYEAALTQGYNQAQSNAIAAHEGAAGRRQQATGALIGAGATLGGAGILASDRRVKEDIRDLDPSAVQDFLEAAAGHEYRYRAGLDDPGRRRVGVMAQDLEGTDVGSTMVDEGPGGMKVIDTEKGFGALLAAMHEMNSRLDRLENGKGKGK